MVLNTISLHNILLGLHPKSRVQPEAWTESMLVSGGHLHFWSKPPRTVSMLGLECCPISKCIQARRHPNAQWGRYSASGVAMCSCVWTSQEKTNNSFARMTPESATRIFNPAQRSQCICFSNVPVGIQSLEGCHSVSLFHDWQQSNMWIQTNMDEWCWCLHDVRMGTQHLPWSLFGPSFSPPTS